MSAHNDPRVALCPRCFCPLNINQIYSVDLVAPAYPSDPHSPYPDHHFPTNHATSGNVDPNHATSGNVDPNYVAPDHTTRNRVARNRAARPPATSNHNTVTDATPPSVLSGPQQNDTPTPSPAQDGQRYGTNGGKRRCSTSSMDSAFTNFTVNTAFGVALQAAEEKLLSQQPSSSPPIPPSSPPPMEISSPILEPMRSSPPPVTSRVGLTTITESPVAGSTFDELPATECWVVFRGHTPGIYDSSAEAIAQTAGYPRAYVLAFNNPAVADVAYERFLDDGVTPMDSPGPWVVYVGRMRGVFTIYEELCASVFEFPDSVYHSCNSVEEGNRVLQEWLARPPATAAAEHSALRPTRLNHQSTRDSLDDNSWWCCFAGRNPGVYYNLARVIQARPALGGVRRVNSEEAGWFLMAKYANAGQVHRVPSPE